MDRGEVVDHIDTPVSEIQVCHYDLADPGNPILFVTACEPEVEMHDHYVNGEFMGQNPRLVHVDTPVERGAINMEWPQFTRPQELDEFIEKLQAQRAWLAETDPAKRYEMVHGEPPDWEQ